MAHQEVCVIYTIGLRDCPAVRTITTKTKTSVERRDALHEALLYPLVFECLPLRVRAYDAMLSHEYSYNR